MYLPCEVAKNIVGNRDSGKSWKNVVGNRASTNDSAAKTPSGSGVWENACQNVVGTEPPQETAKKHCREHGFGQKMEKPKELNPFGIPLHYLSHQQSHVTGCQGTRAPPG